MVTNPNPRAIDYGASKAAITHFTRSLALQLGARGIRVNAVAPALVFSPFLSSQGMLTEQLAALAPNASVFGRVHQPGEIAPLFVALADPLKTGVTGEVFTSGGGAIGP